MSFNNKRTKEIAKILSDAFLKKNTLKTLDFEGKWSDNCNNDAKQGDEDVKYNN